MSTDALEQAKKSLGASFGDYSQEINAQRAQAAALIASAEQLKRIADVLEGAYDPDTKQMKVEAWTYDARRELG